MRLLSSQSWRSPAQAGRAVVIKPGFLDRILSTSMGGLAQREGGPIEEIRPGDVIWSPPGESRKTDQKWFRFWESAFRLSRI